MNSRVLIVLLVVMVLLIALGIGVGASNSNTASLGSQPDWVQTLMRAFVHTKQLPIQDIQDSTPAGCFDLGLRMVVLTPGQTCTLIIKAAKVLFPTTVRAFKPRLLAGETAALKLESSDSQKIFPKRELTTTNDDKWLEVYDSSAKLLIACTGINPCQIALGFE
jgi:hypothetical protein